MTDYRSIEDRLRDTFVLRRRPVAVAFREAAPAGVAKFTGTEPSGYRRGRRQALATE